MGPYPAVQTGPEERPPRFVLLEHRWNGVHWDLMLESGPTLRTWAIDAPIVAGADLPARQLGDHRLIYLDYEGPISGDRGAVRRLERGTFEILAWAEDRVAVVLRGDQLKGAVELWRDRAEETSSRARWRLRLGKVI